MVINPSSHFLMLFILLNVLYSRGSGFPALGTYSTVRLGNAVGLDAQSSEDQSQSPVKTDSDIYQSPLSDNDQLYYQLSPGIPRTTRHADGIFTSEFSKLLGQLSARRYLDSLIGKRVGALDEQIPVKRHSDAVFTDNYSRIRKQMAVKKYINSLLTGKRRSYQADNIHEVFRGTLEAYLHSNVNHMGLVSSQEDLTPANLSDTPPLVENYDSVTVDEVLSQLPALNL